MSLVWPIEWPLIDLLWKCNVVASQDMLYQWSMPFNTDQCRIKILALTPMSINKHQCRSMKINIDQYFSILLNADYWATFWINNRILIRHWSVLNGIDHWYSMSCDKYESDIKIFLVWSFTIQVPLTYMRRQVIILPSKDLSSLCMSCLD